MDLEEALKVMGLEKNFVYEDLKRQYRDLIKKNHPDQNDGSDKSTVVTQKLNEAKDILLNYLKRIFLGEVKELISKHLIESEINLLYERFCREIMAKKI